MENNVDNSHVTADPVDKHKDVDIYDKNENKFISLDNFDLSNHGAAVVYHSDGVHELFNGAGINTLEGCIRFDNDYQVNVDSVDAFSGVDLNDRIENKFFSLASCDGFHNVENSKLVSVCCVIDDLHKCKSVINFSTLDRVLGLNEIDFMSKLCASLFGAFCKLKLGSDKYRVFDDFVLKDGLSDNATAVVTHDDGVQEFF